MNKEPHILIIDDARDIREPLLRYLQKNGYRAQAAPDAAGARKLMKSHAFDLLILDIMMPGEDGLSLLRHVREQGDTPVIFLSARGEDVDRIVGLELGADDYLVKPFNPRELLARVSSVLRRLNALPPGARPPQSDRIRFDQWVLDTAQRELAGPDGIAVPLSQGEFRLLMALIERPKVSLTRDQLLDITRGREAEVFDRSIDNAISRLRRKIEKDPKNPRLIKTVWGGGYLFTADPAPA
jgi:two-component system OmpR family response regulator